MSGRIRQLNKKGNKRGPKTPDVNDTLTSPPHLSRAKRLPKIANASDKDKYKLRIMPQKEKYKRRSRIFPKKRQTAPQTTAPQNAAPQTTAPQNAAPQTTAPQNAAPQTTAPQNAAPQTTAPQKEPSPLPCSSTTKPHSRSRSRSSSRSRSRSSSRSQCHSPNQLVSSRTGSSPTKIAIPRSNHYDLRKIVPTKNLGSSRTGSKRCPHIGHLKTKCPILLEQFKETNLEGYFFWLKKPILHKCTSLLRRVGLVQNSTNAPASAELRRAVLNFLFSILHKCTSLLRRVGLTRDSTHAPALAELRRAVLIF
uniref:Uncharacterized protein n=1 Tax=Meloidogyne incognita TaxID=6306 RepID=A0A914LHS0_MELIC